MIPMDVMRGLLEKGFPGAEIELENPQGDGEHYQARIVSERFKGLSLVQQHQLVYGALGDAMRGAVHALALKTYTPEQWAKAGARR